MVLRISKTVGQRTQRRRDLLTPGGAQFLDKLPQARMDINPHSFPVNALD